MKRVPIVDEPSPTEDRPGESRPDGRVLRAQRLREERRALVLSTARRLFAERGYRNTSIHDIIQSAGIARGTFYLYFEGKRAIFDELLDVFFATLAKTMRPIEIVDAAPPIEQMHDNVRRLFSALSAEREMTRVLVREAVGFDDEIDTKLGDFFGRVAGLIERGLRKGMDMGLVRPCRAELVSWCVLGSVKAMIERVFVHGPSAPDRLALEADLPELEREMVELILRGVFR